MTPACFFEALLGGVDDAVVVTAADGAITHWNGAAETLLGYSPHDIVGQHARVILPRSWWAYYPQRVEELKKGTVVTCDSVRRHKNGDAINVHAKAAGIFDESGTFVGYYNIFKDLRKRDEIDLTNAFLAAIVTNSLDAIISSDIDFIIRSWNAAAERLFGYRASEVIGKPLEAVLSALQVPSRDAQSEFVAGGRQHRFETDIAGSSGRVLTASVVISPLLNAANVPTGWSISCSDISERKRLEEHNLFVMRELSHRAKNLLAVITSMARNSVESKTSVAEFEADFTARLRGLAKSHDLLVNGRWEGAALYELIWDQLKSFIGGSDRLSISGPDVLLTPAAAQALGLAVHELATNALKYGALSCPNGSISITVEPQGSDFALHWIEAGGPLVSKPEQLGFGSVVTQEMISTSLGSEAVLVFEPTGLRWSIQLTDTAMVRGAQKPAMPQFEMYGSACA